MKEVYSFRIITKEGNGTMEECMQLRKNEKEIFSR